MLRTANRKTRHWLGSLVLACVLLFCAAFNVQAAGNADVAVIGATIKDGKIYTTLYCADESKPEKIDAISYYVDGKLVVSEPNRSVTWVGHKARLISDNTFSATSGHLTVIISVSGDPNGSNDNRTVVLQRTMPEPPSLEEEDSGTGTVQTVQSVSVTSSVTTNSVTLSWSPTGSGVTPTGYQLVWNNGETTVLGTATTYTKSGLASGTTYSYKIIALGNGTSSETTGTATTQTETINPVTNVVAAANSATQVKVTWTAPTSGVTPTNYLVTRTGGGETKTFNSSGTPFIDTSVSANTTYTYTVTAQRGTLSATPAASNSVTTPAAESETVVVNQVENLKALSATSSFVTLTWDAPSSGTTPTGYVIYRNGAKIGETTDLTYTDSGVSGSVEYTYRVVAVAGTTQSAAAQVTTTTYAASVSGGLADLVVTDISWSPANPKAGDEVVFTAVVKNKGSATTTVASGKEAIIGVRFAVGGRDSGPFTWSDTYTEMLKPGESVVLTANSGDNGNTWTPSAAGTYTVYAWVDDQGRIGNEKNTDTGEDNTGNNDDYTESITVKEQTPVELPDDGNAANVNLAPAGSYGDRANSTLTVLVDGQKSPCFNAWVNTSCIWDQGHYETTPVTIFEMKQENRNDVVRVALGSGKAINSVVVRPLSAGIQPEIKKTSDGEAYVEFTVNKWGSYSVEFNGETKGALQVFVNPDYSNMNLGGRYIPLGTMTGEAWGFEGTVYGSGVLLSSHQGAVIEPGSGARIYGITIANEYKDGYGGNGSWEVQVPDRNDIEFKYFHIIACSPNSDGISIQSSSNIRIYNSYFRTWDDGVVLKNYSGGNTNNITVKDCVFWTDLAQSMEIGAETNKGGTANSIYTANFENIDIIHANHKPAMSIHNMDNVTVRDVHWKNVTIEDAQMGNNHGYGDGWPLIIDVTNVRGGEVPGTDAGWTRQWNRGTIQDVTFENITVLSWQNDKGMKPGVRIMNSECENGGTIKNISITNLNYKGVYVTNKNELSNNSTSIYSQFYYRSDMPHEQSYLDKFGCSGKHNASYYTIENFTVTAPAASN